MAPTAVYTTTTIYSITRLIPRYNHGLPETILNLESGPVDGVVEINELPENADSIEYRRRTKRKGSADEIPMRSYQPKHEKLRR